MSSTNGTAHPQIGTPTPGAVRALYRAAVKLGDNYHTFESDIVLPVGADAEAICAAMDTAQRIRQVQAANALHEIDTMSEDIQLSGGGRSSRYAIRDPEAPASAKQRNAIERMAAAKGWDTTRLVNFCELAGVPLLTLTKGGASWLIDALNGMAALPPSPARFTPAEAPLPFELPAIGGTSDSPAGALDEDAQDIPF